jgi:DNA-binding transcriptional MerR regulator
VGVESEFGIGELARRTKRSVHAIRWYEAQGLIPNVARDSGGRRRYTQWHVDWLNFLDRLKTTAMPVRDMKRYAALIARGEASWPEQEALLRAHRETVSARMREVEDALALIDRKLKHYARVREGRRERKG